MMIDTLKDESQLSMLIPLIEMFEEETEVSLSQNLIEVSNSLQGDIYLTIFGGDENAIKGYLCGYFSSRTSFMITQLFSSTPELTEELFNYLQTHLRSQGVTSLLGHTKRDVRVFRKFGFEISHYLLIKRLEG